MSKEEKEYIIKEVLEYNDQIENEKKSIVDDSILLGMHSLLIGLNTWLVIMSDNKVTTVLWCIVCALNGVLAGIDVLNIRNHMKNKTDIQQKCEEYIDSVDADVSIDRRCDKTIIRVK